MKINNDTQSVIKAINEINFNPYKIDFDILGGRITKEILGISSAPNNHLKFDFGISEFILINLDGASVSYEPDSNRNYIYINTKDKMLFSIEFDDKEYRRKIINDSIQKNIDALEKLSKM